jgi:hypothetical protein
MNDSTEFLAEHLAKPVTAGGLAFLATRYLTYGTNSRGEPFRLTIGSNIPVINNLNGTRLSIGIATGLFVMIGSIAADVITGELYPYIHKYEKFQNIGSGVVLMSTVSVTSLLTHYIANPEAVQARGMMNIVGMAVACEAVANIAYDNLLRPMLLGHKNEDDYDYFSDDVGLGFIDNIVS